MFNEEPNIVVLIPCFNEEQTVAKVINDYTAKSLRQTQGIRKTYS